VTRTPPGRAGRGWLRHRLEVADRAAELLELKVRALLDEQRRLTDESEVLVGRWRAQVRDADEWLLRTVLAGGRRAVRLAAPAEPGDATVGWTTSMGVRYPDTASYLPPPSTEAEVDTGAAVVRAREAYRLALDTAVRHAAALGAAEAVAREVATSRRRLRALHERRLPDLRAELHALELDLEERERAEDGDRRRASNAEIGRLRPHGVELLVDHPEPDAQ
jgi:V/A-type H+-transporting ATPase subunit D